MRDARSNQKEAPRRAQYAPSRIDTEGPRPIRERPGPPRPKDRGFLRMARWNEASIQYARRSIGSALRAATKAKPRPEDGEGPGFAPR
jgi:hypothetical protein